MSASNAASPASAASPPVLAPLPPSSMIKVLASKTTALPSASIFTHKEWIIPPRPKPGRKPAADAPPTKRKAQNRQAQRAFRERRAARVGELEEEMKEMEEEDAREQADLHSRIGQLEADLQSHNELMLSWQQRMQELEAIIIEERKLREIAEAYVSTARNAYGRGTEAVALPTRTANRQESLPIAEDLSSDTQSFNPFQDDPVGCGKCSLGTRCECFEEACDSHVITTNDSEVPSKRSHSPPTNREHKRFRQDVDQESASNEIDFTTRFSTKKPPNLITSASSNSLPSLVANQDPCGFCQDGSPCQCAEFASEAVKSEPRTILDIFKPNPTEPSNPCINGPGTCAQCLTDANSTLFCKSLAATRPGYRRKQIPTFKPVAETCNDDLPPTPSYNTNFPTYDAPNPSEVATGLTLSCADAYETLSRHPAFEQASEELSTWMPKLATVPGGRERTAFEVEAASVMGVLKFFDRRFGKRASKREDIDAEAVES
ncbi:MAG: hypothetical protein Q9170_002579 [Blastenia crenularia]